MHRLKNQHVKYNGDAFLTSGVGGFEGLGGVQIRGSGDDTIFMLKFYRISRRQGKAFDHIMSAIY